jgi:hypothetical protein
MRSRWKQSLPREPAPLLPAMDFKPSESDLGRGEGGRGRLR